MNNFLDYDAWSVVGRTSDGRTFRPTNWADRLMSSVSTVSLCRRCQSPPGVTQVSGAVASIRVLRSVEETDPALAEYLRWFARTNNLQIEYH